jgi:hypothetical protein
MIGPLLSYFNALSTAEVQRYLRLHENDDVQKLLLKQKDVHGVPAKYIAQLISARQKVKHKLPSLWQRTDVLYPPSMNLEQASSEATAIFKSNYLASMLSQRMSGADLTGGFGVDTFFLSKNFPHFDYVEKDPQVFEIAQQNFKTLRASNIECHLGSSEEFLYSSQKHLDFIYIDPSRRKGSQKVFRLGDCEPDVTKLQDALFSRTDLAVVKASPLLDIQQGISELRDVAEVAVVAVDNECRELLFVMKKGFKGEATITAVDLRSDGTAMREMAFKRSDEQNSIVEFSAPKDFVYEPGAAILKAGAFKWISKAYKIQKLAPNTHLYTSNSKVDFPGRTFRILEATSLDNKLKNRFTNGYANILTRNSPLSVEEIKKKTGLKEGGEQYLICTQDQNDKLVLIAERLT